MSLQRYEYSQELINEYDKKEKNKLNHLYDQQPERKPHQYSSLNEAMQAINIEMEEEKRQIIVKEGKPRKFNLSDVANIIIRTIAMTVIPSEDEESLNLAIYDYDKKIYVMSYMHLNKYLVAITGLTSRSQIDSLTQIIVSREEELCFFNPLPKYKIAVGNGIYNCLTKKLEPFTPLYTVLTRISTNYIENPIKPVFSDGFTLEKMIADFANNNVDRIQLLSQIIKSILTGVNTSDVFFIIIGPGGDGKSTMFSMVTNLIGKQNASFLNFSEINNPDKLLTTLNKKLMLGMDNDINLYIKKTALIKSMASHETITLQRKYMNSISVNFSPVIVQLCNEMPRFSETKESMRRRIVTFKSENSHYKNGTQNNNIKKYIKDKYFLEYALWYFLNEEITPYYNDYNEIDRELTDESLNNDDVLGQFIEDMVQIKYINDVNKMIPLRHLYALYLDWFNENNPGAKPFGMRTFKTKISEFMYKLGYTFDPNLKHHRVQTLQNQNYYFTNMLEDYKNGFEFQRVENNNNQVKCFEKTHDIDTNYNLTTIRSAHPINVVDYFEMGNELRYFAEKNNYQNSIKIDNIQQETQNIKNDLTNNIDLFKYYQFKQKNNFIQAIEKIKQIKDLDQLDDLIKSIEQITTLNKNISLLAETKSALNEKNIKDKKDLILSILNDLKNDF